MGAVVFQFNAKLFDFSTQDLVFFHFTAQEAHADPRLDLDALGGKEIQVSTLVGAVPEVVHLDQAFFYQRFKAVVGLAEAHAQVLGEFPLADWGTCFQVAEELQVDFLVDLAHAIQPC